MAARSAKRALTPAPSGLAAPARLSPSEATHVLMMGTRRRGAVAAAWVAVWALALLSGAAQGAGSPEKDRECLQGQGRVGLGTGGHTRRGQGAGARDGAGGSFAAAALWPLCTSPRPRAPRAPLPPPAPQATSWSASATRSPTGRRSRRAGTGRAGMTRRPPSCGAALCWILISASARCEHLDPACLPACPLSGLHCMPARRERRQLALLA